MRTMSHGLIYHTLNYYICMYLHEHMHVCTRTPYTPMYVLYILD